jgi:Ca-activated chloride channel family protein
MHSGGSTNGGAGIALAYKMAKKHFVKGGVNRVILGTDGDFNVGVTGDESLVSMVEREAKSGVFLSVLGFGQGNLNDSMLEKITNKGNGNYFYIDSLREGRKVFLDDMMGNMVAIAKDVKIQIEFNPSKVSSYRLIGYANRMLKKEDFKNKLIDAGEIGAGHTVTALYEIVPGNAAEAAPEVDELKYQKSKPQPKPVGRKVVDSPEMMTVKLAYKQPEATKETESTYFSKAVVDGKKTWQQASEDFKFSSGVALFGMLQRQSEYAGQGNYALVRKLAEHGRGEDEKGHRTEFSDIVRKLK